MSAVVDKTSNDYSLNLNICTSFIPAADGNSTNMAVIEAELPTGFVADLQSIQEKLKGNPNVKKIETKNGNTVVVIYLDSVSQTQICLQVTAYRTCQVADEKPVSVQVYDYYNNGKYKIRYFATSCLAYFHAFSLQKKNFEIFSSPKDGLLSDETKRCVWNMRRWRMQSSLQKTNYGYKMPEVSYTLANQ